MTFMNLCLQTAFIPNTKPVSTLLIANAGLGKTSKLERLRDFEFVKYTMDITPKILMEFLNDVERGHKKYIVIPDYIATLGHAKKTIELTRAVFRGMIEEGITDIDVFGMNVHFKSKVRAGLISGITPEYFNANTRVWKNDGFLSRFVPFSYGHTNQTRLRVLDNVRDKIDTIKDFQFHLVKQCEEPTRTKDIDNEIRLICFGLLSSSEPPYRMYLQLVALCNASAVLRGNKEIKSEDVDLMKLMSNFINRGQHQI